MPARQYVRRQVVKRQAADNEGVLKVEASSSSATTTTGTATASASSSAPLAVSSSSISTASKSSNTPSATPKPSLSSSSSSSSSLVPPTSSVPAPITPISSATPTTLLFSSLLVDVPLPTALAGNTTGPLLALSSALPTLGSETLLSNSTIPQSTALPIVPTFIPDSSASSNAIAAADNSGEDPSASPATKHAAIAVGSIFGAIVLACIVFIILRMRRGLRFAEVFQFSRKRKDSWSSHGTPQMTDRGNALISNNGSVKRKSRVMVLANALPDHLSFAKPRPAPPRPGTASSQRPLVVGAHPLGQISEEPESPTFDLDRPILHIVNGAPMSSPSTPGPMTPAPPMITRQTASPAPEPLILAPRSPVEIIASPVGSPLPEYLQDAKFATTREEQTSRSSDPTSQAPRTPKTPHDHRLSAAVSTTSSVPRYRTVDSWCGAQANRLGDRPVQDHLQQEIEAELQVETRLQPYHLTSFTNAPRKKSFGSAMSPISPLVGDVPMPLPGTIATPVSPIREDSSYSVVDATPAEMAYFPNPKLDQARKREKCHTLMSDITVFKAHPGTPVVFSDQSERVSSMILDARMNHSMPDILRTRS